MKKILALALVVMAIACKKEPVPPAEDGGVLEINLEHYWESDQVPFTFGTPLYNQANGDSLTINVLRYYISNLALLREDSTWWYAPESYYLVDFGIPTSTVLKLKGIPDGKYLATQFMLGVDSVRNVSGAQTGALSLTNAMFWSWSTGYIMMKCEGVSPQSPLELFVFHVGGFAGDENATWKREFDFNGDTLDVVAGTTRKADVHVFVDQTWKYLQPIPDLQIVHTPGMPSPLVTKGFFEGFDLVKID